MQCELCGAPVKGALKTVRVEGAELQVCANCEKLGVEVQQPKKTVTKKTAPHMQKTTVALPQRKPRDVFDMIEGEIADDYAERIRKARMAKGWSQLELAQAIKERELLIKKVEKGDLIPEDELRKKIEHVLAISLIDSFADDDQKKTGKTIVTTLGDLVSLKKPR